MSTISIGERKYQGKGNRLRPLKNELHRVVGEIRRIALFFENTPQKHTHFRASALARRQTVELQGQAPTTSNVTFTLSRVACE